MHRPILKQLQRKQSLAAFLLILLLIFTLVSKVYAGQDDNQDEGADENYVIAGLLLDSQDQPITEALVTASSLVKKSLWLKQKVKRMAIGL